MLLRSLGIIKVGTAGVPVSIGQPAAVVIGTEVGPYAIVVATNDTLLLAIDGGADQPVTLTPGVARTAAQIVADINAQTTDCTAAVVASKIQIASNTVGSTSSVLIQAVANSALVTLGIALGLSVGVDDTRCAKLRLTPLKGNAGDIYIGSKINFDKTTGDGLIDRLMKAPATPAALDVFWLESTQERNILHTCQYFIDADNAGDGVIVALWIA